MTSASLDGRVALVTGASRGIGKSIALALARAGAKVAVLSTTKGGGQAVVEMLAREGTRAVSVAADVRSPPSIDAALTEVENALGPVDILVNNAGVVRREPLATMSDEDFDDVVRVNLSGPFYFARRLIPKMEARGHGRVVNISSVSSVQGTRTMTGYCASKWGLNGLTKALAQETHGTGVFVAAVLPGGVDTEMLEGSGFPATVKADEVARTVLYLCSEAPPSMSGALVEIFG